MKRSILGPAAGLALLGALLAVQPQQWSFVSSPDFLRGKFLGVSLESSGLLVLAPREEAVEGPAEEYYLSLAEARDGTLFLGTGHGGKIYRLPRGGAPEVYFQTAEMGVTCLALGDRDVLYAGTSPNGKIYKITAKDTGDVFFNPDEKYIWDLLADGGRLLAAVGESGGIYEIGAGGEGRQVLKALDSHILCLALEPNGDLLAGSAGNGFLYRVTRAGKATVVFDPLAAEVKALALGAGGDIYLAACGTPSKPRRAEAEPVVASAPASSGAQAAAVELTVSAAAPALDAAAASPAGPSALYRVGSDGRSVKLWSSSQEFIHDLAWDEGRKKVLVGSGNQGRLYAVDASGVSSLLFQKSSEQVTVLAAREGRTAVLSNNPARLDILLSELRTEAEYLSPVLDAGTFASWGRIAWQGETPAGSTLQLQTRSGNAPEPSPAWSDWSPPYHKEEGEPVLSPAGRYLQFRALFRANSGRLSPSLRRADVFYLQANAAPVVTKVEALPPNDVFLKPPEIEDVILGAARAPAGEKKAGSESLLATAKKTSRRGFRTLIWEAEDGNGDSLAYNLSVRRDGDRTWRFLERNWTEKVYALDTLTLPDGVYEFKVEATDGPSNPPGRDLRGEKTGLPLTIDNTPPVIKGVTASREGGKLKLAFQAEDSLSPLREVRILIRPQNWLTVFPTDGICDSRLEAFSLVIDLPPGSDDMLTIAALDAHGNPGVFRQSFAP